MQKKHKSRNYQLTSKDPSEQKPRIGLEYTFLSRFQSISLLLLLIIIIIFIMHKNTINIHEENNHNLLLACQSRDCEFINEIII